MSFTISDLKTRLEGKLHGTTTNKVQDLNNLIFEAGGNLLLKIDPAETKRVQQLSGAMYDQVFSYAAPTDLKGDKIIDIRPQSNRTLSDNFSQSTTEQFDSYKSVTNNSFSVELNSGVKTIKISKALTAGALLNDANSLTDNGTWAVGGNATDLAADTLNKITGTASLKFNISAAGSTAYIENSTMTAVDLSTYKNVGALFVYVYIPSTTIITSVNLRWGSSTSDYYNRTVTATQDNTALVLGWNLLRFDWDGATQVGTPVDTAIDTLRVTFAYSGTAVNSVRVDNIIARIGQIEEVVYYSKYLFQNSSGTWLEKPTADTDTVNLDVDSFNLLLYEVAYLIAQQLQGEDASFDASFFKNTRDEVWSVYMRTYKSEKIKRQNAYYRPRQMRRR